MAEQESEYAAGGMSVVDLAAEAAEALMTAEPELSAEAGAVVGAAEAWGDAESTLAEHAEITAEHHESVGEVLTAEAELSAEHFAEAELSLAELGLSDEHQAKVAELLTAEAAETAEFFTAAETWQAEVEQESAEVFATAEAELDSEAAEIEAEVLGEA